MRKNLALLFILGLACILHLQTIQAQVVGYLPENHPRFKLIARFQTGLADQNSEALLLHTYDGAYTLSRYDLASGSLSVLGPVSPFSRALLIPNGYINYRTNGLFQVEGAEELNLGPAGPFSPAVAPAIQALPITSGVVPPPAKSRNSPPVPLSSMPWPTTALSSETAG